MRSGTNVGLAVGHVAVVVEAVEVFPVPAVGEVHVQLEVALVVPAEPGQRLHLARWDRAGKAPLPLQLTFAQLAGGRSSGAERALSEIAHAQYTTLVLCGENACEFPATIFRPAGNALISS